MTSVSRFGDPLKGVRFASNEDAPVILELVNESMAKTFRVDGVRDLVYLIENCVLSICLTTIKKEIVGFLAVKEYPLIPSVAPSAWEEYLWRKYKAVELNARNTLFVHMLCWNPIYARDAVDRMMKSVFMHDAYVLYIAMVKSLLDYPLLVPGQVRAEASFRRVNAMEKGIPGDMLPCLCIADRSEVCPRLRIRRAVEEDNDDIVPILERHSPRLRQMYGEFYISELISRHPESERVLIVCEDKELAVGVMCLNTQINLEALEESFQLSPFGGLRHLVAKPSLGSTLERESTYNILSDLCTSHNNLLDNGDCSKLGYESKGKQSVMSLSADRMSGRVQTDSVDVTEYPIGNWDHLALLDDDEEELEFDIINIDNDLLRLPQVLSYEKYSRGAPDFMLTLVTGKKRDSLAIEEKFGPSRAKKGPSIYPATSYAAPEPPRYKGPTNAFLLELFAMHPDYDERYGFDMLEVAFELFPDREYCVMCLPSNHSAFPLLEHFTFVTPFANRIKFINETLYAVHINSVRGNVRTRPAEAYDQKYLSDLIEHAPRRAFLTDLFETSLTSSVFNSFILLSENQPIGLVILGPFEDSVAIRTKFDLNPEPVRAGTDGAILGAVVSPVFEAHARWFMRDVLRFTRFTTLFWACLLVAKGESHPCRNLMSLVGRMMPVRPRRAMPNITVGPREIVLVVPLVGQIGRTTKNQPFFRSTPFALWVMDRPLSGWPKVDINNSIVVVGASATGLAFIETLFMGPSSKYLTFTNVTLVSAHGIPSVTECLRAADIALPNDSRYNDKYLKSVPFIFYLDIISAVMVNIDRKRKCIHLKNGGVKFYDTLVLTCGEEFQHPDYLQDSLELAKEIQKGKPCDRILMDNPKYLPDRVNVTPDLPDNVMIINTRYEANVYLRKLMKMISDLKDDPGRLSIENRVVVYGECLEAYCCITALLELGLSPDLITFVEPFPPEDETALRVNCFNHELVDDRVQASLDQLGIQVFRRSRLTGWRVQDARAEKARFMSRLHVFQLPTFALFYYGRKAIDINAFKAINECGLVYDGGLIVGSEFETNDPHIFGAGTCTRFSRRLYADRYMHRYYCSEDVGEALGKLFLKKLDPFLMGQPESENAQSSTELRNSIAFLLSSNPAPSRLSIAGIPKTYIRWQPVPKFQSAIVKYACLPGPLYYMKIRRPGPEIPMEVALSLPHQGHTLMTDKNNNYFRIQLNELHCVVSVTCLSKKKFIPEVISQLYQKHESFFHKLLIRYQLNMIDDLYKYFVQPWMSALYQETFEDLLSTINDQPVGTVYDLVKSRFDLGDHGLGLTSITSLQSERDFPQGALGPKDAPNLGTFRSIIEEYVAKKTYLSHHHIAGSDIPPECGQTRVMRNEASAFWEAVSGERIVMAHLSRYLHRHAITNPQYATPNPDTCS